MKFSLRKHIDNNIVVILTGLPNLAITTSAITLLSFFWHWSFVLAPTVYYLVGQVVSVQYSATFGQVTNMTFTLLGKTYRYSRAPVTTRDVPCQESR